MERMTIAVRQSAVVSIILLAGCGRGDALAQDRQAEAQVREQLGDVPAVVDTTTAMSLSRTFRAAAARALPSVVTIQVTARPQAASGFPLPFPFGNRNVPEDQLPPQIGMGSGFVYNDDGYIITNNHVVENATQVQVRFVDGRIYDNAEVVGSDANTDVAVIRIQPRDGESFTPLALGNSDRTQVGDWVIALGNPLSLGFTVTAGIVSAKGRSLGIIGDSLALESFIQTDAAINRGNSGGPLVDLFGRVVGVNTAIASPTGLYAGNGFAIPIALAAKAADDIIEYGYVRRPRIGVVVTPVTEAQAELYRLDRIAGAVVSEVDPAGPAAEAGLRPEDVIVAVDGEPIETSADLTTGLARRQVGQEVTLAVVRDGRRIQVPVTLGEFEIERPERRAAADRPSAEALLGLSVVPLTPQVVRELGIERDLEGVVVGQVNPNGPAAAAGLQRGDVILEFNRERVRSVDDLQRLARDVERGDIVVLRIRSVATGNTAVRSFRVR